MDLVFCINQATYWTVQQLAKMATLTAELAALSCLTSVCTRPVAGPQSTRGWLGGLANWLAASLLPSRFGFWN